MVDRARTKRLEIRTTAQERALFDRAAEAAGTDLTTFAISSLTEAAQRVLADRDRFVLSKAALAQWETINRRRAVDLPGLRRLMKRPSPFTE